MNWVLEHWYLGPALAALVLFWMTWNTFWRGGWRTPQFPGPEPILPPALPLARWAMVLITPEGVKCGQATWDERPAKFDCEVTRSAIRCTAYIWAGGTILATAEVGPVVVLHDVVSMELPRSVGPS